MTPFCIIFSNTMGAELDSHCPGSESCYRLPRGLPDNCKYFTRMKRETLSSTRHDEMDTVIEVFDGPRLTSV
jgi:hypothetical protein